MGLHRVGHDWRDLAAAAAAAVGYKSEKGVIEDLKIKKNLKKRTVADSFWYMAKPIQYCKVK